MNKNLIIFVFIVLFLFNTKDVFASSCTQSGNMTFCSDGTNYTQSGNMTFGSDGSNYTRSGNTTFGSNGTSCTQSGNMTFCSDGTSYTQSGNMTFGSDGSNYTRSGNTTFGTGGNVYNNCPANSSYDSLSRNCKCDSGYILDSADSCTSGNTVCRQKYGYGSSYSSFDNKCSCDSGYRFDSTGQCVTQQSYCTNTFGYGSEYSSLKNSCVCKSGYEVNSITNKCVVDTSNSPSYTSPGSYAPPKSVSSGSCPLNSHTSTTDTTKCQCNSGYQINASKTACSLVPTKTNDQVCQDSFGLNVSWDGTKNSNGNPNCNCKSGYSWNTHKTACFLVLTMKENAPIISPLSDQQRCQILFGANSVWAGQADDKGNPECDCATNYEWNATKTVCVAKQKSIAKVESIPVTPVTTQDKKPVIKNEQIQSEQITMSAPSATALATFLVSGDTSAISAGSIGTPVIKNEATKFEKITITDISDKAIPPDQKGLVPKLWSWFTGLFSF